MKYWLIVLVMLSHSAFALQNKVDTTGYFGFEPDIVTNTADVDSTNLAGVRMRVQLMLEDEVHLPLIEHHEPLLKSILIKTVSSFTEKVLDSASGKEQARRECLRNLQAALQKETGKPLIRDVIFTFLIADPL